MDCLILNIKEAFHVGELDYLKTDFKGQKRYKHYYYSFNKS